jgi:hypothetical protein
MYIPTRSMQIKGLGVYLQLEDLLNFNMHGSLFYFLLGPNPKMKMLCDCDHQMKVVGKDSIVVAVAITK